MIGADFHIDSGKNTDVASTDYYQKLQKELREKNEIKNNETISEIDTHKNVHIDSKTSTEKSEEFIDKAHLSKIAWEEDATDKKEKYNLKEWILDAQKVYQNLGVKINFKERLPQLKDMFIHNIVQSKSNNVFMSRFAQFKVGVIGQILAYIGVPIEEIKKMKDKAIKNAFDENIEMMAENIYNLELILLFKGETKKNKRLREMHTEMESTLIEKMNNLGRFGFWSKSRLYEEKITQCKKIHDELQKELDALTYQLEYRGQVNA
jgi:hypothetical protein